MSNLLPNIRSYAIRINEGFQKASAILDVPAQMVDVGLVPNDGRGDRLDVAYEKWARNIERIAAALEQDDEHGLRHSD
jgi:hypothetical protein